MALAAWPARLCQRPRAQSSGSDLQMLPAGRQQSWPANNRSLAPQAGRRLAWGRPRPRRQSTGAAAPPSSASGAGAAGLAVQDPPASDSSGAPDAAAAEAAPAWSGDWAKAWWAVAPAAAVDGSRPQPFTLLGKRLVIWRDASTGAWACLEDRCPHRAVPLSEGKVWEDGTLLCSYHGFRFDAEGACRAIPQAPSEAAAVAAAASPRACAVAYPIRERQGMLFVWGEGGAAAAEESRAVEPPGCPVIEQTEAAGGSMLTLIKPYTRDLPYSFSALLENIVDPAHVPFSHHGVMGDRSKQKHGMWDLQRAGPLAVRWTSGFGPVTITYHPPGLITYATERPGGGRSCMTFFLTPIAPCRSRITLALASNTPPPLPARLLFALPAWVDHVRTRSAVFDGDNVFLAGQDALLARHGQRGDTWRDLYYMPTAADALVAAARSFLDAHGGGPFGALSDGASAEGAAAAAAAAAELSAAPLAGEARRRPLLDRYSQHVVHCPSCMQALRVTTALRAVAACLAAVAAAAAALLLLGFGVVGAAGAAGASLAARAAAAAVPVLLAVAAGVAALLLDRLRRCFLFKDYVHAER